jgi:hypothetical protein
VLPPTFTLKRQIAGFISGQVLWQRRDVAMMTFLDDDCDLGNRRRVFEGKTE